MKIPPQPQYELLDSGEGKKLERYGDFVVARPDPQAIWQPALDKKIWDKADATFISSSEKGTWLIRSGVKMPENSVWPIELGPIKIYTRLTPFKHTGIFPEQFANWTWIESVLKSQSSRPNQPSQPSQSNKSGPDENDENSENSQKPKVLNLFGYTGGASIVAALQGAEVTHVDASRSAITWAKENMILNNLPEDTIRWILDDAVAFAKKELKRGNKYDAIMMDPPIFGRGAKGEVWKIEEHLQELLDICFKLLSPNPLFFILNGYAAGYSSISYAQLLEPLAKKYKGEIEHGELLIEDTQGRLLPSGIVARWKRA